MVPSDTLEHIQEKHDVHDDSYIKIIIALRWPHQKAIYCNENEKKASQGYASSEQPKKSRPNRKAVPDIKLKTFSVISVDKPVQDHESRMNKNYSTQEYYEEAFSLGFAFGEIRNSADWMHPPYYSSFFRSAFFTYIYLGYWPSTNNVTGQSHISPSNPSSPNTS